MRTMGLLLQEYDQDRTGDLNFREFTNLITQHEIRNGRDKPVVPSEAEIAWILQVAGKHRENAIDVTELDLALKLWDAYVWNRAKYAKVFSNKVDPKYNQRLEFDQLKLYLTKSTGFPPKVQKETASVCCFSVSFCIRLMTWSAEKNSDVRAMMHKVNGVDGINLMQLALVTLLWYRSPSTSIFTFPTCTTRFAPLPHPICSQTHAKRQPSALAGPFYAPSSSVPPAACMLLRRRVGWASRRSHAHDNNTCCAIS